MFFRKSTIIEKTQKLASKGQFGKAILEWEKLLATLPNDGNIYNAIGDLHLKAGQQTQATDFFIKAAEAFQSAGFELKSIAIYKKALKLHPSRTEIIENLANLYADRGLLGDAISDYLKVAEAYFIQENFGKALSVYRKISDLDPSNTDIHLKIADLCKKAEHPVEAIESYKKLLSCFEKTGQSSEAEQIVQKILALDPSYQKQNDVPSETDSVLETKGKAGFEPELNPSNSLESHADQHPGTEENPSELFEPEPELMTEEQTIYSPEASVQITGAQGAQAPGKSLETYLSETDVYMQYELVDKAVQHLKMAIRQFPSALSPLLKLKEIYKQQRNSEQETEAFKTIAEHHQQAGEETEGQVALDESPALHVPEQSAIASKTLPDANPPEKNIETFEPVHQSPSDDALVEKAIFAEEALFQEITHHPALHTGEQEASPEAMMFDDLPQGPAADDHLPELEQDPPTSLPGPELTPLSVSEDPFLDLDRFDPKELDTNYFSDEIYDIDFDGTSLSPLIPSSTETGKKELKTHKPAAEKAEVPSFDNSPTSDKSGSKKDEDEYVDLQGYFSEVLSHEETRNDVSQEEGINFRAGDEQQDALENEYDLGMAYREMGMLSEAVKAFENASKGKGRFIDALTMLAICHRERGSIEHAFAALEKGLRQSRSDQNATVALTYELALLYEEQGDLKAAAPLYEVVFELDPAYREVSKKLRREDRVDFSTPPQASSEPCLAKEKNL